MGVGRTPAIRQLCSHMDDDNSYFGSPRGSLSRLGRAEGAREMEPVSSSSPGASSPSTDASMSCRAARDRFSLGATSHIT